MMGTTARSHNTLDTFTEAFGERPEGRLLSASQINKFLLCPRQWYFRYVMKIPEKETIHMSRGKAVHTVCEKFFDERPPGGLGFNRLKGELQDRAQVLFDKAWREENISEKFGDELYNETWEMILKFLQIRFWEMEAMFNKYKDCSKAWNWTKPKFKELHILDRDLLVEGYIDSVIERNGEVILVDYKTSSIFKFPMNDDYKLQLYIYGLLYYNRTRIMPDYVAVEYLRYGKVNTIPMHEVFLEEAENKIQYVRERTESKDIQDYRKETACGLCKWCSYQVECMES